LTQKSRALLREFRMQAALLEAAQAGQLLEVQRDASGAIVIDEGEASDSVYELLKEIETSMARERQRLTRMLDTQSFRAMTD
jgi:hypothetical protein